MSSVNKYDFVKEKKEHKNIAVWSQHMWSWKCKIKNKKMVISIKERKFADCLNFSWSCLCSFVGGPITSRKAWIPHSLYFIHAIAVKQLVTKNEIVKMHLNFNWSWLHSLKKIKLFNKAQCHLFLILYLYHMEV